MEDLKSIPLRKTFLLVSLVGSVLGLALGFWFAGQWVGCLLAILVAPAWLLARSHPVSKLPVVCLFASVALAVVGRLTGSSPWFMLFGSAFSLAVWDLLSLEAALGKHPGGEQTRRYEMDHLQSLALVLGAGLSLAGLGRLLQIQLPFIAILVCVALGIFGLDRIREIFMKPEKR